MWLRGSASVSRIFYELLNDNIIAAFALIKDRLSDIFAIFKGFGLEAISTATTRFDEIASYQELTCNEGVLLELMVVEQMSEFVS